MYEKKKTERKRHEEGKKRECELMRRRYRG